MLAYVDLEERVAADHPLRTIKALANQALAALFAGEVPGLGGIIANTHGAGWVFIVYAPVILLSALLLGVVARETLVKHPAKVD